MSKVSFRARQIDFNKPLPIIKHALDWLPEFSENSLVNRGVPHIPSGMEKEEENEHHFVEAIQALQNKVPASVKIPVPEIQDFSQSRRNVYSDGYVPSTNFVHLKSILSDEDDRPDYDLDSDDEEWLSNSELGLTKSQFESMIDKLEHGCGQKENTRRRTPRKRKSSRSNVPVICTSPDAVNNNLDSSNSEDQFAFLRLAGCRYARPRDVIGATESPDFHTPPYVFVTLTRGESDNPRMSAGYFRRRIGRGGRVILDRLAPPQNYTDQLTDYDPVSQSNPPLVSKDSSCSSNNRTWLNPSSQLTRSLTPLVLGSHRRTPTLLRPLLITPQPFSPVDVPYCRRDSSLDRRLSSIYSAYQYDQRCSSKQGDTSESKDPRPSVQPKSLRPPRKEPHSSIASPPPTEPKLSDSISPSCKPVQTNPVPVASHLRSPSKTDDLPRKHVRFDLKQGSSLSAKQNFTSLLLLTSASKKRCLGDIKVNDSVSPAATELKSPTRAGTAPIFGLPI